MTRFPETRAAWARLKDAWRNYRAAVRESKARGMSLEAMLAEARADLAVMEERQKIALWLSEEAVRQAKALPHLDLAEAYLHAAQSVLRNEHASIDVEAKLREGVN